MEKVDTIVLVTPALVCELLRKVEVEEFTQDDALEVLAVWWEKYISGLLAYTDNAIYMCMSAEMNKCTKDWCKQYRENMCRYE